MRRIIILLFLASLAGGSALSGQEDVPADEMPAGEESTGPKISIHGYLTQAYARSDGHQFLGINEDGTADYRTAALQIRAALSPASAFVAQLSHERFGASSLRELGDDVEVDWLFYSHQLGDSSIKVGRVPIPFGIYNEIRDVGTLLPFYRPPHNFYGEGSYSADTLDGIVVSRSFSLGAGWGLDADVHYGNWTIIERGFLGAYAKSGVHDSFGAELWLDTPVSGLRIGAGSMRYDIESTVTGEQRWKNHHFSLAGEFDRWTVHGEVKLVKIPDLGTVELAYLHLGFNLTQKLTLNAQKDLGHFEGPNALWDTFDDDRALGATFAFSPALVLKAEHHWKEGTGFWFEDQFPFAPTWFKARYWIVSLSTSF